MRIINRYQNGGLVSLQNGGQSRNPLTHDELVQMSKDRAAEEYDAVRRAQDPRLLDPRLHGDLMLNPPRTPGSYVKRKPTPPFRPPDDTDSGGFYGWLRRTLGPDIGKAAVRGAKKYVMDTSPASLGLSSLGGLLFGPGGYAAGNFLGRRMGAEADFIPGRPLLGTLGFRGLSNTQRLSRDYDPYMWVRDFFSRTPEDSTSTDVSLDDETETATDAGPDDETKTSFFDKPINQEVATFELPPPYDQRVDVSQLPPFNQQLPLPMTDVRLIDPPPYNIEHPSDPRLHGDLMLNPPRTPGSYVKRKPTPPLPRNRRQYGDDYGVGGEYVVPSPFVEIQSEMVPAGLQQPPSLSPELFIDQGDIVSGVLPPRRGLGMEELIALGQDYWPGPDPRLLDPRLQNDLMIDRTGPPEPKVQSLQDILRTNSASMRELEQNRRRLELQNSRYPGIDIRNVREGYPENFKEQYLQDPRNVGDQMTPFSPFLQGPDIRDSEISLDQLKEWEDNLTEVIDPFAPVVEEDPFDIAYWSKGRKPWVPGPYGPEGPAPTIYAAQGGMIPNIALQAGGNPIVADVTRDIEEGINSGIRSLVANAYAQGNVPPPPSSPQLNQSQLLNQGLTMAPNTANMPVPQQPQQPPAQSNISNMYAQSTQPQSYYMQPNQIR